MRELVAQIQMATFHSVFVVARELHHHQPANCVVSNTYQSAPGCSLHLPNVELESEEAAWPMNDEAFLLVYPH